MHARISAHLSFRQRPGWQTSLVPQSLGPSSNARLSKVYFKFCHIAAELLHHFQKTRPTHFLGLVDAEDLKRYPITPNYHDDYAVEDLYIDIAVSILQSSESLDILSEPRSHCGKY
jgi:hypothetical protein